MMMAITTADEATLMLLTSPNAVRFPAVHYLPSMWLNCDVMCSTKYHFDLHDAFVLQSKTLCCLVARARRDREKK